MPTIKISELSTATTTSLTDVLPIVQSGTTKQVTVSNFLYEYTANNSGSFAIPTNSTAITTNSSTITGSMYVDPVNSKIYVFTGKGGVAGYAGWQSSSLA